MHTALLLYFPPFLPHPVEGNTRRSFYSFSEQKFSEGEGWDFLERRECLLFLGWFPAWYFIYLLPKETLYNFLISQRALRTCLKEMIQLTKQAKPLHALHVLHEKGLLHGNSTCRANCSTWGVLTISLKILIHKCTWKSCRSSMSFYLLTTKKWNSRKREKNPTFKFMRVNGHLSLLSGFNYMTFHKTGE